MSTSRAPSPKKTREDVEELKSSWLIDPCWDLALTEGFEEYGGELDKFQNEQEIKWKEERGQKELKRKQIFISELGTGIDFDSLGKHLSTYSEIETNLSDLDTVVGDAGSAFHFAQFILAREQVRATLLLAAQIQRVADSIDFVQTADGQLKVDAMTSNRYEM